MSRASLRGRLTGSVSVLGFRLGWSAVRAMPERAAYGLFERIADAAVLRGGKGVERLRSNYARVRPELTPDELDDLVHDGMRSYMRYYCEAFRLPSLRPGQIDRAATVSGYEPLRDTCRAGGTAIAFVGHLGNFDMAAAWSARNLAPVTTVAERLKPEEVFQDFVAFRNSIQMDIIPLEGAENPFHELLRTAKRGGRLIALASDRDLTANGVEVDLLGHRARMAKGPALLALMTDSPLYAARVHYEKAPPGEGLGGYRTVVELSPRLMPRVDGSTAEQAQDLVQQCADHLAATIRTHTSSWHMLQRVFVEDLDPVRAPAGRVAT
ncbi:lipid A biosynthesis acyltransferase [Intrasporangium chromatireducens Q5-1]|uniref:Lipid A biosynthesis acyltransferase n=1 Tax=Intrasporangium chromatireducens Q5-1 TaxID=584657 RepID=W9GI15_9MICO|nr:phosphatidylinositol mannoside acyltransferase [Intrasporangium chromatireducens]EWT05881.1 lipid A biosynthesis acyltransferase [Intrasporangium chromatireducens Q5-1]